MTRKRALSTKLAKEAFLNLFRKRATEKYPEAPASVAEGFRGKQVLDLKNCISCSLCARECPAKAIEMVIVDGKKKPLIHLEKEISSTTKIVFIKKTTIAGMKKTSWMPPKYRVEIKAEASTNSRFLPSRIRASFFPLNSVRQPATTSDSDSGILNGAVSSSAIKQITSTAKPIGCRTTSHVVLLCHCEIVLIERLFAAIAGPLSASAKGISKLII